MMDQSGNLLTVEMRPSDQRNLFWNGIRNPTTCGICFYAELVRITMQHFGRRIVDPKPDSTDSRFRVLRETRLLERARNIGPVFEFDQLETASGFLNPAEFVFHGVCD